MQVIARYRFYSVTALGLLLSLVAIAFAGKPTPTTPAITYTVKYIAPPAGYRVQDVRGISDDGDMVGYLEDVVTEENVPFVFMANAAGDGGVFLHPNDLLSEADAGSWDIFEIFSISRNGKIAVHAEYVQGTEFEIGVVKNATLALDTGEFIPKTIYFTSEFAGFSRPWGINDFGDRCGDTILRNSPEPFPYRAFVMPRESDAGTATFLFGNPVEAASGDGLSSISYAINNAGQVAGEIYNGKGFRYTPSANGGEFLYMGKMPQTFKGKAPDVADTNEATDINSSGQICGWANTSYGGVAYRYTDGVGMVPLLNSTSWAYDINDSGNVLGGAASGKAWVHLQDKNKLVYLKDAGVVVGPNASDVTIWNSASHYEYPSYCSMNNRGVIAGPMVIDYTAGDPRSGYLFLLLPN